MIQLTINGETRAELLESLRRMLADLSGEPLAASAAPLSNDDKVAAAGTLVTNTPRAGEPAKRRGRPPKTETVAVLEVPNDPLDDIGAKKDDGSIPDFLKRDAAPPVEQKTYTLDEVRERVKACLKAQQAAPMAEVAARKLTGKALEAANAEVMQKVTTFLIEKLFTPFGAKNTSTLKPDQYSDFMAKSEKYAKVEG